MGRELLSADHTFPSKGKNENNLRLMRAWPKASLKEDGDAIRNQRLGANPIQQEFRFPRLSTPISSIAGHPIIFLP
ncbi:MAG: hypothetical protein CM15mP130_2510 [Verrucomicrobiota bacterium]|nr:MAG: hypothetical protein CM15mP130_2510 [Verrucomicrobiota bacterium]